MRHPNARRWSLRWVIGFLPGAAVGFLLAVTFGLHHPTIVVEVSARPGSTTAMAVDGDLDPARVPGLVPSESRIIYRTVPPTGRFTYRISGMEEAGLSNRVAQAFGRPVRVLEPEGGRGRVLGIAVDAWIWILLGGTVGGVLLVILPVDGGGKGVASRPVSKGWRWAGAVVVCGLAAWGAWYWGRRPPPDQPLQPVAARVEPGEAGQLRVVYPVNRTWRLWRSAGTNPALADLLTADPIRIGDYLDRSPLPGAAKYWVTPGDGPLLAPAGPGIDGFVMIPPGRVAGWREGDGLVRVEWEALVGRFPDDVRLRVMAGTNETSVLASQDREATATSGSFDGAIAAHPGRIHVAVATVSSQWGTSAPVRQVVAPRAETRVEPALGGGFRLLFPAIQAGHRIWRAPATNPAAFTPLVSDPVRATSYVDAKPLPGKSLYWIIPALPGWTPSNSVPHEAWMMSPASDPGVERDLDGTVRLRWKEPRHPNPPDAEWTAWVRDEGGTPMKLELAEGSPSGLVWEGGRTNGTQRLEFQLRWMSSRWGDATVTSVVAAVAPPTVRKRVAAVGGRFHLPEAGIERALHLQWVAVDTGKGAMGEWTEERLDQTAVPHGSKVPIAEVSLPVPSDGGGGLRAKQFALMAANAGGRTRVTEWTRIPGPTREHPFTNSIGQPYVPVSNVLFCVWETRVRDFREFARSSGFQTETNMSSWDPDDKSTGKSVWKQMGHSWEQPGFEQTEDHPVVGVSWNDAVKFCEWLTERERKLGRIGANDRYRLPTDAEWSQAVGPTRYPWGDGWPPPNRVGNYADKDFDAGWSRIEGYEDGYRRTSPVGTYAANERGLHDLGGNVWEWVEDWYRADMNTEAARKEYPGLAEDGGGNKYRVLRGASWNLDPPLDLG